MKHPREPRQADIVAALNRVNDPCSLAARSPVSIMEMGLVREWSWDNGRLDVTMCVTSISCTMAPHFVNAARDELLAIDGVEHVNIRVDASITWTETMMQRQARERLAARRAEAREIVRPQQWRQGVVTS
jgi:metal-sulfur cluster biosynthetic enzyme